VAVVAAGVIVVGGLVAYLEIAFRRPEVAVEPLPAPDVSRLGAEVQEQIADARSAVEELPVDAGPAAAFEANKTLAMVYHAHGLLPAAQTCYHRALALAPEDFETQYLLALACEQGGDLAAAEAAVRRATQLQPSYAPAWVLLGRVYWTRGDLERSAQVFSDLLRRQPSFAAALFWLGRIDAKRGRTESAVEALRAAAEQLPDSADVEYALAMVLRDAGQAEEAAEHLRRYQQGHNRALYDDPCAERLNRLRTGADYEFNRGLALADQGRWAEAVDRYRAALAIDPNLAEAHNGLGLAWLRLGRAEEAVGALRQAVALNPNLPQGYTNLGRALGGLGRNEEARSSYAQAVKLDPNSPAVHNDYGNFLSAVGDLPAAEAEYRAAIRLAPGDLLPRVNLGTVLYALGKYPEASGAFREALTIAPGDPQIVLYLTRALLDAGQAEEAVDQLRQMLRDAGPNPALEYGLGEALVRAGHVDQVLAELAESGRVEPGLRQGTAAEGASPSTNPAASIEVVRGAQDALLADKRYGDAIQLLRGALGAVPDHLGLADRLAWLLATVPEDGARDGAFAVQLAERVNQQTGGQYPEPLLTLSAAYAEAGRFDEAVRAAQQAAVLAQEQQQSDFVAEIQEALEHYAAGQPYRLTEEAIPAGKQRTPPDGD